MTIVEPTKYYYILGFTDGRRKDIPYKDLKEVLNFVGVLAKRDHVPLFCMPYSASEKDYRHNYCAKKYYVPVNWRDCLYEDLKTRHFYIISPSQE